MRTETVTVADLAPGDLVTQVGAVKLAMVAEVVAVTSGTVRAVAPGYEAEVYATRAWPAVRVVRV